MPIDTPLLAITIIYYYFHWAIYSLLPLLLLSLLRHYWYYAIIFAIFSDDAFDGSSFSYFLYRVSVSFRFSYFRHWYFRRHWLSFFDHFLFAFRFSISSSFFRCFAIDFTRLILPLSSLQLSLFSIFTTLLSLIIYYWFRFSFHCFRFLPVPLFCHCHYAIFSPFFFCLPPLIIAAIFTPLIFRWRFRRFRCSAFSFFFSLLVIFAFSSFHIDYEYRLLFHCHAAIFIVLKYLD